MAKQRDYEMKVRFAMADREGTAALRIVAGHVARVGDAWGVLSGEFLALADALDKSSASDERGES